MGWGRWWGEEEGGSLCKSLGARPEETEPCHLCAWTHPRGFQLPCRVRCLGNRLRRGDFHTRGFLGVAFRITPCGQMKKQNRAEGEVRLGCSCNQGLSWTSAGLVLDRGLGLIFTPSTHTHPRQPTNQYGMWAAPEQRVGLWA